ncbi:CopD family protein [Paracoccus fontiphilus]|uniref:Protoporphyrinogen IX oxidase n=1 Tax=Paracoccus fontiphilus TaxID=1815556 RepID=A0ABV7IJI9_9RHOB|nr:CopD family protein [Paracoccus fontiphilus]
MIAALKAVHIAAMLCWCAGLIALPLLLMSYGHAQRQVRYSEFRLLTHYGYVGFATPAAVIAIVAGTGLIFAAEVFDLWFVAKLALVSLMALCHAWIGHLIEQSGLQRRGKGRDPDRGYRMPHPAIVLAVALPAMGAVLWLVLAKPDLSWTAGLLPQFMLQPRGQLP